jgi:diacylglycerol kinase (ATP)
MNALRTLVIVNPAAGSGRAGRLWQLWRAHAARAFPFEEVLTTAPGEATRLAADAARAGVRRILVVGGDGTVHEVVNGVQAGDVAVGVLPLGTGNDFARCAGLALPPARLLPALAAGRTRRIDLGTVHGRLYINVAGVGFDAEVARAVNAMTRKAGGTLPYLTTAMREALRFVPPPLDVRIDGRSWGGALPQLMVAVANAPAYGGGMRVCPRAELDDGRLDVLLVGDVRAWSILALLPTVFLGRHLAHPKVRYVRGSQVQVSGPASVAVHADGEIVGGLPATFTVRPAALELWVPA